jgi:hypothetical protein
VAWLPFEKAEQGQGNTHKAESTLSVYTAQLNTLRK